MMMAWGTLLGLASIQLLLLGAKFAASVIPMRHTWCATIESINVDDYNTGGAGW